MQTKYLLALLIGLGTILTGVFASSSLGVFSGQGFAEGQGMGGQILVQLLGAASVIAYSAAATFVILNVLDITLGLRVSEEDEMEGLDIASHDERGYDI